MSAFHGSAATPVPGAPESAALDPLELRREKDRLALNAAEPRAAAAAMELLRVLRNPDHSDADVERAARAALDQSGLLWEAAARILPVLCLLFASQV